jgi:hypothetical protein
MHLMFYSKYGNEMLSSSVFYSRQGSEVLNISVSYSRQGNQILSISVLYAIFRNNNLKFLASCATYDIAILNVSIFFLFLAAK